MKKIILILLLTGLNTGIGCNADISKAEIPARYNRCRDLFSSEKSWEEWCRSDMLELQELDKMWAEEYGEEE